MKLKPPILLRPHKIKGYDQNIQPPAYYTPLQLRSGEYASLSANLEKLASSLLPETAFKSGISV